MIGTDTDFHHIIPTDGIQNMIAVDGNALRDLCHGSSLQAGWYTDLETGEPLECNVGEMLMLIVSEVAETMEGHRKGLPDDHLPHRPMVEVELADTVIRVMDMAGMLGLDIGGAIAEKLAYNITREDHQIENRKQAGGKNY